MLFNQNVIHHNIKDIMRFDRYFELNTCAINAVEVCVKIFFIICISLLCYCHIEKKSMLFVNCKLNIYKNI